MLLQAFLLAGIPWSTALASVALSSAPAPAPISEAAAAAALRAIQGSVSVAPALPWRGINARISGDSIIQADPGAVITGTVMVSDPMDVALELKETLDVPGGWQVLAPPTGSFTMGPGESDIRIYSVAIPLTAAPGERRLSYTAADPTGAAFARADVTVIVSAAPALTLDVDSVPDQVLAGDHYAIKGTLANAGNCDLTVDLAAKYGRTWDIEVDTPAVRLKAGESAAFEVRVKTDRHARREERAFVALEARGSCNDKSAYARTAATTDVIAFSDALPDPYRRFGSQYEETAVAGVGKTAYQQQFSGSGILSTSTGREFDFLAREPDLSRKSLYGQREVYSAQFQQGSDRLLLGDQSYRLSPLLETGFYGRGAGFNMGSSTQGLAAFGFTAQGVYETGQKEAGAGFGYGNGPFDLSVQGLDKQVPAYERFSGLPATEKIGSVSLAYRPNPLDLVYLEYAHDGAADSDAYKLIADLRPTPRFSYHLDGTAAGTAFGGSYNNEDLIQGKLQWAFANRFQAVLTHIYQQYNPGLDAVLGAARQWQEYTPGLRWTARPGTTLGMDLDLDQQRDLVSDSFDYRTQAVTANFKQAIGGIFSVRGAFGYERYDDLLTGKTLELAPRSLYLSAAPASQSFSVFYIGGGDPQVPGLYKPIGGASANLRAGGFRLNATADVFGLTRSDLDLPNSFLTTLGYTAVLPWGHSVDIALHHDVGRYLARENSAFISYIVPINLPLNKRWPTGGLEGEVVDVTGGGSRPVARAVILVDGYAVVTDKRGRFRYSNLPAGRHTLQILRSSIGYGRMEAPQSPRDVVVRNDGTPRVTLSITAAGGVTGRLVTTAAPPAPAPLPGVAIQQPSLPAGMGVRNVLLEISNGSTVYRRYSDGDGDFEFRDLYPGRWRLVVYPDNLPQYYELEQDTLDILVEPGKTQELLLKVVPQVRRLRMVP